jgi:hypothetical protein
MLVRRNPWNGLLGKPAVLKVARAMVASDDLSWPRALRKALAWARRKATAAPADRYAAMRARGVVSPLDRSAAAHAHFADRQRARRNRWGGR